MFFRRGNYSLSWNELITAILLWGDGKPNGLIKSASTNNGKRIGYLKPSWLIGIAKTFYTPSPTLLGSPVFIGPPLSQQHVGLQRAVLQL